MFKYIIIIIYEVPTTGRAEKKKWCRKQEVVLKNKSRAEKKRVVPKKKVVPKKRRADKKSRAKEN